MRYINTTRAVVVALVLLGTGVWGAAQQQAKAPRSLSTEDFTEIERLLYTNHTGYDFALRDNADMWTNTFTSDAVLDNPPTHLEGHTAIRAYALDPYKTDPKRILRHWTTTFHVTPHPEGAILSAFYTTMTQDNGVPGMVWGRGTGRYESLVVKTRAGWRIKHHVVVSEGALSRFTPPPPK